MHKLLASYTWSTCQLPPGRERGCLVVNALVPDPEVGGSSPTRVKLFCVLEQGTGGCALSPFFGPSKKPKVTLKHYLWIVLLDE